MRGAAGALQKRKAPLAVRVFISFTCRRSNQPRLRTGNRRFIDIATRVTRFSQAATWWLDMGTEHFLMAHPANESYYVLYFYILKVLSEPRGKSFDSPL